MLLVGLATVALVGGLAGCSEGSSDEVEADGDNPSDSSGDGDASPGDEAEGENEEAAGTGSRWLAARVDGDEPGSPRTAIIASDDGSTWVEAGTIDGINVTGLAWGQDRWLAIGVDLELSSHVYASTDSESWEKVADLDWNLETLAYGDGRWVAAGHASSGMTADGNLYATPVVYTSTDGADWTEVDLPPQQYAAQMQLLRSVAYGPGGWVISGIDSTAAPDGTRSYSVSHYTSGDGVAWTRVDAMMAATDGPRLALATDGVEWVEAAETFTFDPDGEGYGGVFVDAAITVDPLGEREPVPDTPFEETPADDLAHGDDSWLAVANGPPSGDLAFDWMLDGPTAFYASTDARTWEKVGESPALITELAHGGESDDDDLAPAPAPTTTPTTTTADVDEAGDQACTTETFQQVPVNLVPQNEPYTVTSVMCNGDWAVATTEEGRFSWSRLFRRSGSGWTEVVERPCEPGTLPADIHPIACPAG